MRIIIPSFCLLFAVQVQASFLSRILSKLWIPRLSHDEPVSGTSSPVQKDTVTETTKETSLVTSSALGTEPWTHMGYEPMNVEDIRSGLLLKKHHLNQPPLSNMIPRHHGRQDGSNQLPIEEATPSAAQDAASSTEARIAQSDIPEQVTPTSHLETRAQPGNVSDSTINRDEERGKIYRGFGFNTAFAAFVGYVTASRASYVGYSGLCDAINERRLDIAVELVKQNEYLGKVGVEYVIERNNPDLIANFVKQTNQVNSSTLNRLWRKSSIETFEKVLEKVDFPQQALIDFASSWGVHSPETFLVLLNKVVTPEDQEKIVKKGIEGLVCRPTFISPLLNALKGKAFRSKRLEYLAIQKAFMERVKRGMVDYLPNDFCKHAAITPELYADALTETADRWSNNGMRRFLLEQADSYDLEAVRDKAGYADLNPEFCGAIEKALKTAAPGGTRTMIYDIQSAEKAEETFEELRHDGITTEIADLISAYVTVYVPTPRRIARIAAKKVVSDFTSTSTKIEGSEDIGSERMDED